MPEIPLAAEDVRESLFEALEPVLHGCDEAAAMWPVAVDRVVIQLHPLVLQLTVLPSKGRPARRLAAFSGEMLPDGGMALTAAVEALTGAVLAGLGEETAKGVLVRAAVPGGGLCVDVDPARGAAGVILAEPGKGFEEAVMLGGFGEVMTEH